MPAPLSRPLRLAFLAIVTCGALVASSCTSSHSRGGAADAAGLALLEKVTRERPMPPIPARLPTQSMALRGVRIALDPGHGGDIGPEFERTRYKRGPTGFREAIANMRTAEELRSLLERSGALVLMTRTTDTTVTLDERARMANDWGADLFLSIHHNAANRPDVNYSSVWYHRDGSRMPASLDVARNLQDGLVDFLNLPDSSRAGHIMSDTKVAASGFAVLRLARGAAVLAECSFFTNPTEEKLLQVPEYNRRVAWALYEGLVEWAANGLPRWELAVARPEEIVVRLDDGSQGGTRAGVPKGIREDSLEVRVDGRPWTDWSLDGDVLRIRFERPRSRSVMLDVRFENTAKNAAVTPPATVSPEGAERG